MTNIKENLLKICREKYPYEIEYVYTHLERYYQSVMYIKDYLNENTYLLDIGSNNNGSTFIEYIKTTYKCKVDYYSKDLRYPFDVSSNKYDFVICMEIIEHIKDRNSNNIYELSQFNQDGMDNLVGEIYRVLRTNGMLFITTPNCASYDCILKILHGENPMHFLPHVKEFTYNELIEYLKKFNFNVVKSETLDSQNSIEYSLNKEDVINIINVNKLSNENRNQNTFCVVKK